MRLLACVVALAVLSTVAVSAQWTTSTSVDEMTGHTSAYAHSPKAKPTERMGFPYSDIQAWLGFGTDGVDEWAYVGFSTAPNLTGTNTQDGYDSFGTRVKWDDNLETVGFTQIWGSSFIHFQDYDGAIAKMISGNTVLVELKWYGEGKVYFRFPLSGSTAAIAKARAACK